MPAGTQTEQALGWSDDFLELSITVGAAGLPRLTRLGPPPGAGAGTPPDGSRTPDPAGLPLADVVLAGEGRAWSGSRYCESAAGARLRYAGHAQGPDSPGWHLLRVDLADPVTGLRAEVSYRILAGHGVLRSWVRLANGGNAPVTVQSVTSLLAGGISAGTAADGLVGLDVLWAENDWLAEGRWQRRALRDALPDLNRGAHGADPRGCFGVTSTGTWSCGGRLPMGGIVSRGGLAWVWQVEHNGAWHWQAGEHMAAAAGTGASGTGASGTDAPGTGGGAGTRQAAYIALLGPTDTEHDWHLTLAPGQEFTTVPAALAVSAAGLDDAIGRLTRYRRAARRPHQDHQRLPVIFNDYMNTLSGDPTAERLVPLIEAAAAAGAEYFCIDAGWYADPGAGWWDSVGAWRPSAARFPGGLAAVLDRIRDAGMVPGIWLEPEVVGVRSPVAGRLPAAAFFTRHGQRVVENGRYHLDLRHPAAVRHLDETIDFLAGELGVGYLKLDYNINGGPGTDSGGLSAGAGLLGHNRAHLGWLESVLDRYPGLVIENCASGGMRSDGALLSLLQLQSTSDQQDFLRYPAVMAAAPAAMTPEQAASWAYPQPEFSDQEIVFTLCGALLGRVHLSGHLNRMTAAQRRLVADAVAVYKRIRGDLPRAVPFWPLGLPRWDASWLALGMRAPSREGAPGADPAPDTAYLLVWRRGTAGSPDAGAAPDPARADPAALALPVPHLRGAAASPEVLYPLPGHRAARPELTWDPGRGELGVTLAQTPAACLIRVTA